MKRKVISKLFGLGILFASVYTCLFGYILSFNTVYAIDKNDLDYHFVSREQYDKEHAPIIDKLEFSSPQTKVINGNSIKVGSIYDNLMNDDGSLYYLNRNMNGVEDGRGVPFLDSRNDLNGRKSIIYAHSSPDGVSGPFNGLQNYHNNYNYFQNNRYITINYNGRTYTYEIFSVYISTADNEDSEGLKYYYKMDYSDEEWQQDLNYYKSHSEYDTGVSVNSSDKIVILQTCSMDPNYFEKYYRYNLLVMGKFI